MKYARVIKKIHHWSNYYKKMSDRERLREGEREREWECVRERNGKELDRGTEREIIKIFKDI